MALGWPRVAGACFALDALKKADRVCPRNTEFIKTTHHGKAATNSSVKETIWFKDRVNIRDAIVDDGVWFDCDDAEVAARIDLGILASWCWWC